MGQYILAIDNGTTGTRAALIDAKSFRFIDQCTLEYKQHYPRPGQVEHDLNEIWSTVEKMVPQLLKKTGVEAKSIHCIGITNQRETCAAFDTSGAPLANALVWQDRRTHDFCLQLRQEGKEEFIRKKTGLPIDPYFSATKMKWLIENNQNVSRAAQSKSLRLGTIDTFLIFKFTSGQSHVTDATNASRTLLMDLKSCQWDNELLSLFKIPDFSLPKIVDSFGTFGRTKNLSFLPDGIPISGVLGDQQAALFGQACLGSGEMKSTYGTGGFLLMNTGDEIKFSNHGLLTTVAYRIQGQPKYALEGSVYIAGAAVQYLRDNFKFFKSSQDIEALAKNASATSMENILFFPFFTGIGTPYWNAEAKGAIIGLTRDTGMPEVSRACLEGIALSINDCVASFTQDLGRPVKQLKVDGGAANNNFLMEMQANFSNLDVVRPRVIETTAYGAALAAAVGSDLIKIEEINNFWEFDRKFSPNKEMNDYCSKKVKQWKNMITKIYL